MAKTIVYVTVIAFRGWNSPAAENKIVRWSVGLSTIKGAGLYCPEVPAAERDSDRSCIADIC